MIHFAESLDQFPIPNGSYNITTFFLLIFEVSSVFIFINLLIAVINNTISKVDNNKVLYWQFTKASMQGRNSIGLSNSIGFSIELYSKAGCCTAN